MTTTKPGSGHWAHMSAVAIYPVPIGHLLCSLRVRIDCRLSLRVLLSQVACSNMGICFHWSSQANCTPPVSAALHWSSNTRWSQLISIGPNWSCNWIVSASIDQTLKDKGYQGDQWISNVDLPGGFQPLCCPALQGSTTPTNVPHRS